MVIYILLFLLLLLILYGFLSAYMVLNMPLKMEKAIFERESENPAFDYKWYEGLDKEKVKILSPFGYKLAGYFIPAEQKSDRTIIFCHGITASLISSIKYTKMFYKRGWNLLLYDNRRHGLSEGKMSTYGYYEKHDLKAVVDYVKERSQNSAIIGIHGESMGAATTLQYAGMEDGVSFYICDCPYSSLWEQLSLRFKEDYHLPKIPFLYITNLFIKIIARFWVRDVNPLADIKKINNPVLLIHGDADKYVPTEMSRQLYEAKKDNKVLYIVPQATHARSLQMNPEEYEKRVFEFIAPK